ncbi:hypothetical protein HK102_012553, partial [Quaeritorhiza haematococci]
MSRNSSVSVSSSTYSDSSQQQLGAGGALSAISGSNAGITQNTTSSGGVVVEPFALSATSSQHAQGGNGNAKDGHVIEHIRVPNKDWLKEKYELGRKLDMAGHITDFGERKRLFRDNTKDGGKDYDDALLETKVHPRRGLGAFGTVRIIEEHETGELYACKAVRKKLGATAIYEQMLREVTILKKVKHPHIIRLHEVVETPKKLYLIME